MKVGVRESFVYGGFHDFVKVSIASETEKSGFFLIGNIF